MGRTRASRVLKLTGVTGDQVLGFGNLVSVRVAGTAPLVGAVIVKQGAQTVETIAAGSAVGTARTYHGAKSSANFWTINMGNVGDAVVVAYF